MTPILVALLLGASAQSTGQMSPTSDVSGNRVRATGASTSRALRDHLRTLPDAEIVASGATTGRGFAARFADWTAPEDFGAWGDYVPSTAAGHDDTAALQAALNSGKAIRLGRDKIYKATATLTIPSGTTVAGAGYHSSLIWAALPDTATDFVQLGPTTSSGGGIQLLNFGIVGGAAPGRAAITAWSLDNSVIDVYANGGWEYLMRIWRVAAGITGPEGGGVEGVHLRLWHQNYDARLPYPPGLTPNPKRGLYFRGWLNGSDIWANIGTTTVGDCFHAEGSYSAANNARIRGLYQGCAGWGVWIGGEANMQPHLEDIHAEVNGLGGLYVGASSRPVIRGVYGNVTIADSTDAEIGDVAGYLTITEAARRTRIVGVVASDTSPIANASASTTRTAYAVSYGNGGIRDTAGSAPFSDVNLIVNGDFARFLSTTDATANSVWGVSGYYTATKTGIGLADTTHTPDSAYAAKFAYQPGWGRVAYLPIFDPASVSTYWAGVPITAAFKFKSATPGVGTLSVTEMAGNAIGTSNGFVIDSAGSDAGNGWISYAFTFLLDPTHISSGVGLQLAFNDVGGEPSYYIAEAQAVIGTSAPRSFSRRTRDRSGLVEIRPGGNLHTWGTAAPASGGDPIFGSTWRPGDVVWNQTPAPLSAQGWRNVGAGSPGTWEPMYIHTAAP
jgi:hypothetical protein